MAGEAECIYNNNIIIMNQENKNENIIIGNQGGKIIIMNQDNDNDNIIMGNRDVEKLILWIRATIMIIGNQDAKIIIINHDGKENNIYQDNPVDCHVRDPPLDQYLYEKMDEYVERGSIK
jgi:hypothetical protein